jgi:tetratricopeptide (TPR) repeat protein
VVVRYLIPKPFLHVSRAVLRVLASAALLFFQVSQSMAEESRAEATDGSVKTAKYAGSASCEACHKDEYRQWQSSHHKLAERKPSASRDEAAFAAGQAVLSGEHSVAPRRVGRSYQILATGWNHTQEVFAVSRVIGESPLREFLTPSSGGRLQTLEAAYDPRSNDWFNVYGEENRRPGEWGHWTGRGMNWNSMCAACHNTAVRKNYDSATDSYHTTMAEPTVGCEACHGPLREHNEWQTRFGNSGAKDPTLKKLSADQVVDNCGFCHARRGELTGEFTPGDNFSDQMRLTIVDNTAIYYADGQVRDEDYEYAAFLGSRMRARGVRCIDCHDPHTAKTLLPGNWLCLRCHAGGYTNAPIIDPLAHGHHRVFGQPAGASPNPDLAAYGTNLVQESGGECVNCHMPQTTYMQRHRRHDHGFTTPDPLLTKKAGIPNACNRCHVDRDADWALKWCDDWYGAKMNRPARERALVIAAARRGDPGASARLVTLYRLDDNPYWRAVAAGLLEAEVDEPPVRALLTAGVTDTNALVRSGCARSLQGAVQDPVVHAALVAGLRDPVRDVRLEASWALRAELDMRSKAGLELQHSLAINADQPTGQAQLGGFALAAGDPNQAAAHYKKAVEWDAGSAAIRHDYAVVLARLQRPQAAVEQLQTATRLEPANAEYQFSLGLGWSELGQTSESIRCLREAVRLQPAFSRAWYNLGLALSSTGLTEQALDALAHAEATNQNDPEVPYASATILAGLGKWKEARREAERALRIQPRLQSAQQLLQRIDQAIRGN